LINFIILYRISNGLSVRSLLLFNTMTGAFILPMYWFVTLTSQIELHPLTKAFIPSGVVSIALPFGWDNFFSRKNDNFNKLRQFVYSALNMPRPSQINVDDKKPSPRSKIVVVMLSLTGLIFVAKGLALQGADVALLNIIRENDPIIFLNDIDKSYSFASVQIFLYIFIALPSLAICILSQFSSQKPSYLWELSIIQASLIVTGQFYFIAAAFFWKTPKELQISPYNAVFWVINLIPVLAALMQLNSPWFWSYRVPLTAERTRPKTH